MDLGRLEDMRRAAEQLVRNTRGRKRADIDSDEVLRAAVERWIWNHAFGMMELFNISRREAETQRRRRGATRGQQAGRLNDDDRQAGRPHHNGFKRLRYGDPRPTAALR